MRVIALGAVLMFATLGIFGGMVHAGDVETGDELHRAAMRSWQRSLIPLVASQSLDAASSYGYREMNPLLAGSSGTFGARATTVKFSLVFALVGVEYLVVRKSPKAARILSKVNWSGAAVTTGLVVHNYVVR